MKPKIWTSILLFISAYSPLIWILCINDLNFNPLKLDHPIISMVLFSISVISIIFLLLVIHYIRKENGIDVKIITVKNKSSDIINYTIPYVISFMDLGFDNIQGLIAFIFFMLLLLLMSIKSEILFLNPILLLSGYSYYEIEYNYAGKTFLTTIMSKHELRKTDYINIKNICNQLYIKTINHENL